MIDSKRLAAQFRARVVEMSHAAKAAHLASALSCMDIVTVLYHSVLNVDPRKPKWDERDRFILSKGHAALAQFVVMAEAGLLSEETLAGFARPGNHVVYTHPQRLRKETKKGME